MWFRTLMGFEEVSAENVRKNISVDGDFLKAEVNEKSCRFGTFEVLSLNELRELISLEKFEGELKIKETVGNVFHLHQSPQNKNAVFQSASQFNMLEMVSPEVTPERGVILKSQLQIRSRLLLRFTVLLYQLVNIPTSANLSLKIL